MPSTPEQRLPPTATLAIIRIALVAGVLIFGAVVWYLRSQQPAAVPSEVDGRALRIAGQVVWLLVILGVLVVFTLARKAPPDRRPMLSVVAWALGEATALYGAVFWLLLGDSQWYLYGLVCLVLTYFIFPIRSIR